MRIKSTLSLLSLALLATVLLAACDFSEQNVDWRPGDTLGIVGPSEVETPDTVSYYVQAYTVEKSYTWTVNGSAPLSVRRDGEFIDVAVNEPGTYTIEVSNGEHSGTLVVEGVAPEED